MSEGSLRHAGARFHAVGECAQFTQRGGGRGNSLSPVGGGKKPVKRILDFAGFQLLTPRPGFKPQTFAECRV